MLNVEFLAVYLEKNFGLISAAFKLTLVIRIIGDYVIDYVVEVRRYSW